MGTYKSFFVCTSPRSGSTLLCRLLAETGVAGNPDSHFHEPSLAKWIEAYGLSTDTYASDEEALASVVSSAIEAGTGKTGIFGLRLQRHSFDYFMQMIARLHPDSHSDAERIQAAFGKTLFVFLYRENKLDQAISRVMAEQTGLWHKRADGTELERLAPHREPHYDAVEIKRAIAAVTAYDAEWRAWFDRENISFFQVSYDELSRDPSRVLAAVLSELGLDETIAERINPPTAKLADELCAAWAERYQREQDL